LIPGTIIPGITIPGTIIPGITIPGTMIPGTPVFMSVSATDGVGIGIVLIIPAGIMDGIILTMEATGQVTTVVTGMDIMTVITGVEAIIHTTTLMRIGDIQMAEITLTGEEHQDMDIIQPMNKIPVR
jgi:hypothetical protein